MCKWINIGFVSLFVLLSVFSLSAGVCSAADPETVTMSISDFQTLKAEFLALKQNNERLRLLSNQLSEQLAMSETQQGRSMQGWMTLKKQLTEAQQKAQLLERQLAELEKQLTLARQSSTTAEQGLTNANQSLNELRQAIKSERKNLQRQSRALKVVVVGALICAASK